MEHEFWLDEDELIEMAELFKVFGDSTRIKILCVLFDGEKCVKFLNWKIWNAPTALRRWSGTFPPLRK